MAEYTALMIGAIGVMFFFGWTSFKLVEIDKKKHQGLALGLLAAAFIMTWAVFGLGISISDTIAPASGILHSVVIMYRISIVVTILTLVYFALQLITDPIRSAIKRKELRMEE